MNGFPAANDVPLRSRTRGDLRAEPKRPATGRRHRRLQVGVLAWLLTLGLGMLVTAADAHAESVRDFGAVGNGVVARGNERASR